MKVALVHDYLTQRGGAERVFELICRHFPDADIFTSVYDPNQTIELCHRMVRTSALQCLPNVAKYFRLLAPFYYTAFRSLDLADYDLVISSTSSFAKGVRKRPGAMHICFCHNITRFLWDTPTYLREYQEFQMAYPVIKQIFKHMRKLDLSYAQEPDLYIANSTTVSKRIQDIYSKPAMTINYPVDPDRFVFSDQKDSFFLASARLMSYKRIDIIIDAFNSLGWQLLILGDGPERQRLEARANDNIFFLGHVSDRQLSLLFSKAQAVVVAALEDYGLVPIEANVSGTPVIAYGAGGVLDTQVHGETGILFEEQTSQSLYRALLEFQDRHWDYAKIRAHALENFTEKQFFKKIDQVLDEVFYETTLQLAS